MAVASHNILGEAKQFFMMHRHALLRMALWVAIIPGIIVAFDGGGMGELNSMSLSEQISLSLGSTDVELGGTDYDGAWSPLFVLAHIWLAVGTVMLPGMVFLYLYRHANQTFESNSAIINEYVRKIPKLFWTWIIMVICLALLFLLLIVPGVIYVVFWVFGLQIVLATGVYGMQALRQAKKLIEGRWRETFGNMIMIAIVVSLLTLPLQIQQVAIWQWQGWNPWSDMISTLGSIVLVIYSALCYGVMYLSWNETYEEKLAQAETMEVEQVPLA